jgi:hypothetical protein
LFPAIFRWANSSSGFSFFHGGGTSASSGPVIRGRFFFQLWLNDCRFRRQEFLKQWLIGS